MAGTQRQNFLILDTETKEEVSSISPKQKHLTFKMAENDID